MARLSAILRPAAVEGSAARPQEDAMRTWRKPRIVEKACGCEVSAYTGAEI
jgi:hypothetical protein